MSLNILCHTNCARILVGVFYGPMCPPNGLSWKPLNTVNISRGSRNVVTHSLSDFPRCRGSTLSDFPPSPISCSSGPKSLVFVRVCTIRTSFKVYAFCKHSEISYPVYRVSRSHIPIAYGVTLPIQKFDSLGSISPLMAYGQCTP